MTELPADPLEALHGKSKEDAALARDLQEEIDQFSIAAKSLLSAETRSISQLHPDLIVAYGDLARLVQRNPAEAIF